MSKTVAAALIVKNEEVMLERCLKSLAGCDAIYILDTGSQDRTIEIARQYTKNVFLDYIWNDDFSGAQNHLLDKIRGKEDFILSIDADEYLVDFNEVRKAIELAKDMVRVQMIAEGSHISNFGFGRLFRNTPDIYWEQYWHKHLNLPGEGEAIGDIKIIYGRSPAHDIDPNRGIRLGEKAVKSAIAKGQDPGRNLYYLGREYWYKQRNDDCVKTLGQYVQTSTRSDEKADALLIMSMAYSAQGLDNDARDAILQAININSNFKEAIEWMANISTPENSLQWKRMARTANNKNIYFERTTANPVHDILLISCHNDDETLFTAYTLMRHKPIVIVCTTSHIQPNRGEKGCDAYTRNQETIEAMKLAGCPVVFLGIKDTELTEDILRERLKPFNPETIYTPAYHENGNEQHNLVNKVALEVFGRNKCEQYCSYVKGNYNIVEGSWEIKPTHSEMELKNKMLDCYKSQLNLPSTKPHFDSVRGKSEWLL